MLVVAADSAVRETSAACSFSAIEMLGLGRSFFLANLASLLCLSFLPPH